MESCFYKGKHSFHVYLEGKCFFSVLSLVLTMGLFYMVASSLLSYILPILTFPRILCCEKAQHFDMLIWASFLLLCHTDLYATPSVHSSDKFYLVII